MSNSNHFAHADVFITSTDDNGETNIDTNHSHVHSISLHQMGDVSDMRSETRTHKMRGGNKIKVRTLTFKDEQGNSVKIRLFQDIL